MRRLILSMVLILGLILFAACASSPPPPAPEITIEVPPPMPAPRVEIPLPMMPPASEVTLPGVKPTGRPGPAGTTTTERMIVRTGEISLVVESVVEALDQIAESVEGLDGYVVSSRWRGEEERAAATISIRVPDENFDEAIRELRDLAVRVTSESTSSRDVTQEYIDLESRLRNLEATEQQYLALLERAETVEEVLMVQRELSNMRGQIEQIKGRMQYLERTSALSLITVHLKPESSPKPLVQPGWSAVEIAKSGLRGLITAGHIIADILIWGIIFSPIWVPIGLLVRWRLRRRAKKG